MKRAEKIRSLLAKAARTDNEHERETYQAAAEDLMVKWGIDDAMLAAAGAALEDVVTKELFEVEADYAVGMLALINAVAVGLGSLRTIFIKMPTGHPVVPVYVIGFKSDVERFKLLFEFIKPQAYAALDEYWKQTLERMGPMDSISALYGDHLRAQFLMSYGNAIGNRLRKEREAATEQTTGADLAVISREEKVEDEFNREFPDIESTQLSVMPDARAEMAGWAGGNSANLTGKGQIR